MLRAEVRGLESVLKERAAALDKALSVAETSYRNEFRERWDAHSKQHLLIDQAVVKAEVSVDKRLEAMNELRAQIEAERGTYLSRAAYETNHSTLREQVITNANKLIVLDAGLSGLREDVAALRSGQEWLVRVVVGTIITAVITGVVTVLVSSLRT